MMIKSNFNQFFRKDILEMEGYTPGEQPRRTKKLIKLNTNENPFPPSPKIKKYLQKLDIAKLRLYPPPDCSELREILAAKFAVKKENIIIGNGSDDILNIIIRCCADSKRKIAFLEPSYSLYPVLAKIQGAKFVRVTLNDDFSIPEKISQKALDSALFLITRPNAPSGNSFPKEKIQYICNNAKGIVLIDEAYADFAEDNCLDLLRKNTNLIICRTLSKSYSLAGIRLGFAIANESIIEQMMKVKDSYNVSRISQEIAKIAILDQKYFEKNIQKIIENRKYLTEKLREKRFKVIDSQTNFIFSAPPYDYPENAAQIYARLKTKGIFVRYFPGHLTGKYLRITIGTKEELKKLLLHI